jgi:acyl-CoA thioester hydrolase
MTHDPYSRNMKGSMIDGRFVGEEMEIIPEWIDFNGHLNMAYYGVLFDLGCNHGFRALGFGDDYRRDFGFTTMTADFRIRYLRELHQGDRVRCSFRIVKVGTKAFHYCQELMHSDGWISATAETVNLHVDMTARKVAPYTEARKEALERMAADHAQTPVPDWVGLPLGVRS